MNPPRFLYLALFPLLALAACASQPKAPPDNGGLFRRTNEGYSLLFKLMSDNKQVAGIFLLKHADPDVGAIVKEIAAVCTDAKTQMDAFPKSDKRIEYDVPDLPPVEQAARDQTAGETSHALLHSSDKPFETQLLFSQAQAMDYAQTLCHAIAAHEDDPNRKAFLNTLEAKCADLHQRLMDMLTVK